MQAVSEGGGTRGKEASLESLARRERRLRLSQWLGKEYVEEKESSQRWWCNVPGMWRPKWPFLRRLILLDFPVVFVDSSSYRPHRRHV